MAASSPSSSNANARATLLSILFVFSLVGLSISSPTTKVTPELLKSICSKAKDPALCLSTLEKDPRSSTSNVLGLTTIYTDLAYDKVSSIQKLYEEEAKKPDDTFHLTPKYKACYSDYSKNLVDLGDAKERIHSGSNIAGVAELVKGTITRVEDCVNVLKFAGGEYFPKIYEFNHKYNPDALNLESIVYGLALEVVGLINN